jgi:hypothetical protein
LPDRIEKFEGVKRGISLRFSQKSPLSPHCALGAEAKEKVPCGNKKEPFSLTDASSVAIIKAYLETPRRYFHACTQTNHL